MFTDAISVQDVEKLFFSDFNNVGAAYLIFKIYSFGNLIEIPGRIESQRVMETQKSIGKHGTTIDREIGIGFFI